MTRELRMTAIAEDDGELKFTGVPVQKGDTVEAILLVQDRPSEQERQQALQRLLALAARSKFRSAGPYPTRDELHERH